MWTCEWTRIRSLFLFMMLLSWRTHMTHGWWVEKLLDVCWVGVTLGKVSEWTFEINESSVSVRDVIEYFFVSVDLWVVCLSRCNFMKGEFSGSVRWTRVRSLFMMMMWLSWRTHMTHSWWVEKLLSVCRVDVSLWKVSEWTFEMDENSFSVRGVNELKNSYDSCNWLRVLVVWWMFFLFSKNY